eukprot:SAG31_NODE_920_length_10987_cov_4.682757_7_plen_47_part_00
MLLSMLFHVLKHAGHKLRPCDGLLEQDDKLVDFTEFCLAVSQPLRS